MAICAKLTGIKDDFGFWGTFWGCLILEIVRFVCLLGFFISMLILFRR